jgi:hypothetical protein
VLPALPPGTLSGADEALGHRLRQPDFPAPTETRRTTVAIAGGGIGGLSAAWKLARSGCDDFLLLEMENEAGGNSRAGSNEVSAYPLGAHYLPLPPREARATRELLAELGVLRGPVDAAHPEYDERYLCHAPQERLYSNGYWQEGLWPTLGVPATERSQYTRFQDHVSELRQRRDGAGRRPFALPLALSGPRPENACAGPAQPARLAAARRLYGAGAALAGRLRLPRRLRHRRSANLGLGRPALLRLSRRRGPGADRTRGQRLAGTRAGAGKYGADAGRRDGIPRRAAQAGHPLRYLSCRREPQRPHRDPGTDLGRTAVPDPQGFRRAATGMAGGDQGCRVRAVDSRQPDPVGRTANAGRPPPGLGQCFARQRGTGLCGRQPPAVALCAGADGDHLVPGRCTRSRRPVRNGLRSAATPGRRKCWPTCRVHTRRSAS